MDTEDKFHSEYMKNTKMFSQSCIPKNPKKYNRTKSKNQKSIGTHKKQKITSILKNINNETSDKKSSALTSYPSGYKDDSNPYDFDKKYSYSTKKSQNKNKKKKIRTPDPRKKSISHTKDLTNAIQHHHHHHKKKYFLSKFDFIRKINYCKSHEKPIKLNLVSQKFKLADDFNEQNSLKFLYEKDLYLQEMILSDEILEEEDSINLSKNLKDISSIFKVVDDSIYSRPYNDKKNKADDSIYFISELIKDIK